MLKKIIPTLLSLSLIFSGISYTFASGNIEGAPKNSITSAESNDNKASASNKNKNLITENSDQSNAIYDNSVPEIAENSTKYNGMASEPIPEIPGATRYSTAAVSLAPDILGTKYEEAAELLGALGIMVGDAEDGAFRPDDPIIRCEMAKVAVYSVGLEDIAVNSNGKTRFPDVPSDHWATGAINVADQQNMVIGDDVGTFRPDDPVLLQEAVAIIVRAMGYEPAANERGGYPSGYLYIASSNQLLRGISGSPANSATRGDIAQLIFNSLTVNLMEQVGYGSQINYEVVDKTLLYDKLNVEKGYGQVTGTGETTLTGGSTTADDRIQIGDKQFNLGKTNAKEYLGFNVLYYARIDKTTDEKTLIALREQTNKNKWIDVDGMDIVSVTGEEGSSKSFEYWANETDKNTKIVQIDAEATYIYNGKYKEDITNEMLKPKSGNVILLDADMNGIYEIVFVNHFTNIVVDTVSSITGRITDKYLNGSLVLDDNNTEVKYSLIKNHEEIGINDLKEWNVISYTISDDKLLIKGYVSDESVSGSVTEITEKGYRIGNNETLYKKAENYPNEISLRDKGTFYLDIEGNIAGFDENSRIDPETGNRKYGYLVGAIMNDGFETTGQFKIFESSGQTSVLTSTEKMRYNSSYGTKASDVIESLNEPHFTPQLIVYETNSNGDIIALETAVDGTETGEPNKNVFTLNINENDMVYKSASNKLGNVGITENTIIFDIPSEADTDTTKYSVRNRSSLSNDSKYDALVYDLQDNYAANVVIITSSTGTTSPESPIVLVDHISETQNEDYEDTDRLYGWQDGKEIDILAQDKSILRKTPKKLDSQELERGDIIQYRLNNKDEIDGITLLFDASDKNTEFSNDISEDMTCLYGKVTRKFSGSINMSINGEVRNLATGDAIVYLFDSERTNNNIQVVSSSDIEIYEEGNEARLFVRIYKDEVKEMVIVR